MNIWKLPTSVQVAGVDWDIETDYRVVIDVLVAFRSDEYDDEEKMLYCMIALIKNFDDLDKSLYQEAMKQLAAFIDMNEVTEEDKEERPVLMDWSQDACMIIPAVNRVIGKEIRAEQYMHWWTFLAAYLEMGECSFTNIVGLRAKKSNHKKLEKWEKDFIRENKSLVEIKRKPSKEEEEWMRKVKKLMG